MYVMYVCIISPRVETHFLYPCSKSFLRMHMLVAGGCRSTKQSKGTVPKFRSVFQFETFLFQSYTLQHRSFWQSIFLGLFEVHDMYNQ